ncbi:glycosyltransferase family 4 protein [Bradyrhizobium sp. PRIMUS42]|uniref:glycosyltransferase family 4 protein n=1 Tax=Bradyrhizobium sp. PRIMUS42 TaxID=2908926 RepID=UPI001FF43F41|nr:glycosyltransferase family 4 protein [Bradyrhizobium sp. PRIMUS42]MCJ9729714.1 glycosyltransferase family 4 protein [Bradyrhizobium sp. PRIMUS42]
MTSRVVYLFPISHRFRLPFHEKIRAVLAKDGVEYTVCYSAPFGENLKKRDTVDISWGHKVPLLKLWKGALLQLAFWEIISSDLVIIQQENRLLVNYVCQLLSMLRLKRVAYFGHGRNFQAKNRNSIGERWKKFWATKVNWWFAYTEETKDFISKLGFPEARITVFNNAVDTNELQRHARSISLDQLQMLRSELGLSGKNIGIYVGGLYREKRIDFLINALDKIRASIPDFEFIFVGGGPDLSLARSAAESRPWVKITGPKFDREKVELMLLAKVFLMPGLVGLAVLDAYSVGLPVFTTDYPYHSPEIAYVIDGVTGAIAQPWHSADGYAAAVIDMLRRDDELERMSSNCREQASKFTIDEMVTRFSYGIRQALADKPTLA